MRCLLTKWSTAKSLITTSVGTSLPQGARDIITELHYVDPPHDKQLVDHRLSIRDATLYGRGPTGLIRRPARTKRPMGITPDDWRSMTPSVMGYPSP